MAKMQSLLGLIGGMSWESTLLYYRQINQGYQRQRGGLHSPPLLLHSVDFAPVAERQSAGDWPALGKQLGDIAAQLAEAGAGALVICTNTMHYCAPVLSERVDIPLLHIADAVGEALVADKKHRVALLGTRFTMQQPFYKARLASHGLDVLVPKAAQQELVHEVIYQELCQGTLNPASKKIYQDIIIELQNQGAEAVIFGCTEIGLLLQQNDSALPIYDSTDLHCKMALRWLLD